jgi:hypothetical protein
MPRTRAATKATTVRPRLRGIAGDKAGNWPRWYRDAIKLAEDR